VTTRTMWQGSLSIRHHEIPVKLYSAVMDRQVHFHLLHKRDGARLRQRMIEAGSGEAVPLGDARKAFQVEPGVYVALRPDELEAAAPEPTREIELSRFVPAGAIDPQLFERPYYLGPAGRSAGDYFTLAHLLARKKCVGIASWVMRKHSYVGALVPRGGYLMLITLRHAGEFIPASELDRPAGRALAPKEKKLAAQLVEALAAKFRPEQYHDAYESRVRELVEAKRSGKKRKTPKRARNPRRRGSLAETLAASLKRAAHPRARQAS
jgi:DNA end-binding protein Ku